MWAVNRDSTAGHYHGLLHRGDLLTVDLSQSADVAFQSGLQRASGLKQTDKHSFGEISFIAALEEILAHTLQ